MADDLDRQISGLLADALARFDERDYAAAAPLYRSILELDPTRAGCWHDLGIVTKHLKAWDECRAANRRALALAPDDEGAAWNLGIAGTALADWTAARDGWRAAGIELPPGNGPAEMTLGPVPIRVANDGAPEVVWCRRIDPARAIVLSVPTAGSGRRYHDLVLHDGSRNGERLLNGVSVPVFDELEVLAPSAFSTYEACVEVARPDDVAALQTLVEGAGGAIEDWTANVQLLCRACSEGNPDSLAHDHSVKAAWSPDRTIGIASEGDEAGVQELLSRWIDGHDRGVFGRFVGRRRRTVISLERVVAGALRV
jgi:tetratricopeptide repeat protein